MKKLNWIVKNYSSYRSDKDISIKYLNKNERNYVSIILRNKVYNLITNTNYIAVAIDDDRLYFKGVTDDLGYKLGKETKGGSKTVQIYNKALLGFAKYNQGDYELKYDKENKLYYIECE